MNLLGLSPTAFFVGLAALSVGLFGLHLLRVRLRREVVDSLLFFQQVADVQRPRTLLGAPRRWLAFLLALLAIFLLWFRYAEPGFTAQGPSRVILLDASRAMAERPLPDSIWRRGRELSESSGLGPRGAVFAIGSSSELLLSPGEAPSLLESRAATLERASSITGLYPALDAAAEQLGSQGEIVWIGRPLPLPTSWQGLPLRSLDPGERSRIGLSSVRWTEGRLQLHCWAESGEFSVSPIADDNSSELTRLFSESPAIVVYELAPPQGTELLPLRYRLADRQGPDQLDIQLELPLPKIVRVQLPGLEEDPRGTNAIFEAIVSADPGLELATGQQADVRVSGRDSSASNTIPTLEILPGVEEGTRHAQVTEAAPRGLVLRNARSESGRILPAAAPDEVTRAWIIDVASGAALVRAVRKPGAPVRIQCVDWLLGLEDDRDLPLLLGEALRVLGGERLPALQAAGEPFRVPGLAETTLEFRRLGDEPATLRFAGLSGSLDIQLPAGNWQLGEEQICVYSHVQAPQALPSGWEPPESPAEARFVSYGERSPLPWLLLLGALLLLLADVWFYHRGRLP
jgi:hypothetical protein